MVLRTIDTRAKSITNRKESTSFEKYLKDISSPMYKLLSIDEEVELGGKIKEGDIDARNALAEGNLRFVVSVAKPYLHYCKGLEIGDLIGEGNIGLIKAAQRFDETRGFKFISYAVWRIRQSILQYISSQTSLIKRPMNQELLRQKVYAFSNIFYMENLRDPTKEELQEQFPRLDDTKYKNYISAISSISVRSLDEKINDDENDDLQSIIPNGWSESPDSGIIQETQTSALMRVLSRLPQKEKDIITMYYGIGKQREYSLEEIAEFLDISRERVRQIRDKALKRLKHTMLLQKMNGTLNE